MTLHPTLEPEVEKGLVAQATARGVSLLDYVNEIVVREAHVVPDHCAQGQALIDGCAKIRGLLTDEEVDTLFSRDPSGARPVNFE